MTQDDYIVLQKKNIDQALALGQRLLKTSAGLHQISDAIVSEQGDQDHSKSYLRDSLMYFSLNDAVTEISGMPEVLQEFKQQLIDIKIANDRMMLDGGYRQDIDEAITGVFLSHTLCKVRIIDQEILSSVKDALAKLESLKAALEAM